MTINTALGEIDLLVSGYFLAVICIACATVLAKLFGHMLLEKTSGPLHRFLACRVNVDTTGDEIVFHLFDRRLLSNLHIRLIFSLCEDFRQFGSPVLMPPPHTQTRVLRKLLVPETYRSGCPPNLT